MTVSLKWFGCHEKLDIYAYNLLIVCLSCAFYVPWITMDFSKINLFIICIMDIDNWVLGGFTSSKYLEFAFIRETQFKTETHLSHYIRSGLI